MTRGAARARTWDAHRLTLDIIRADTAADLSVGGTTRAGAVMITLGWTRATVWTLECRPAQGSSSEPRGSFLIVAEKDVKIKLLLGAANGRGGGVSPQPP